MQLDPSTVAANSQHPSCWQAVGPESRGALNPEDDFIGSHSGRREFALVGHRKDLALFSD